MNCSFAVELRLSFSWTFPVGYPCEDPAQLEALETVNSKPMELVCCCGCSNAVPTLRGVKQLLTRGWPPARAVVTAGADVPELGISPCTHVRGGFLISAPLSGQSGVALILRLF